MRRLEYDADTQEEVINYFQTRARQLLPEGFVWQKDITQAPGGLITTFIKDKEVFKSYYCYASSRGKGFSSRVIGSIKERIVTTTDCHIEEFLIAKKKSYVLAGAITETAEYKAIQEFYHDRKAARSQCYLMNHIDEALFIMTAFNASDVAKRAFCIHPLVQNDQDLTKNWEALKNTMDSEVLALAMEYRNIANAYLSHRKIKNIDEIALSPIADVNQMLIGDKIQNYKDFLIYHYETHARSEELKKYFKNWLKKLDVEKSTFVALCESLKAIELKPINSSLENKEHLKTLSNLVGFNLAQVDGAVEFETPSAGFRRFDMTLADFKYIKPINKVCDYVLSNSMKVNHRHFDDFLKKTLHKQLKAITRNDIFSKKYALFQLKEQAVNWTDIEYYEVCYSTNWTASGHAYYLFRFYLDPIEPSCVLEKGMSEYPYHSDPQEANRPKIIISTHYKDFSQLSLLFLQNYKREISKTLGVTTDVVDNDTVKLINMLTI